MTRHYTPFIEILVVCTGNICRSPMAEVLLRSRLAARGVAAGVSSAGLAVAGRPVPAEGLEVMRLRGFDVSSHRSRRLAPALVERADLVLGMEGHHAREAMLVAPGRFERIFTLRELVRRAEQAGSRTPDESFDGWLARVGAGRTRAELVGLDPADDVADPYGRSVEAYEQTAATLVDLVDRLVDRAWPLPDNPDTPGAAVGAEAEH